MRAKRVGAVVLLGLAIAGCSKDSGGSGDNKTNPQQPQEQPFFKNWKQFSSSEGRSFKVTFPVGDPAHTPFTGLDPAFPEGIAGGMKYIVSHMEKIGEAYVYVDYVNITEFRFAPKSSAAEREKALDAMLRATADKSSITLAAPKTITWAGKTAQEYEGTQEIKNTDRKANIIIRVLATDHFGYFGIVREAGNIKAADIKRFFDSFELVSTGSGNSKSK